MRDVIGTSGFELLAVVGENECVVWARGDDGASFEGRASSVAGRLGVRLARQVRREGVVFLPSVGLGCSRVPGTAWRLRADACDVGRGARCDDVCSGWRA
eukprot:1541658-Rhodomonas_salina.2